MEGLNVFTGLDGIPFRTSGNSVPFYKNDDPARKRPATRVEMHVELLELGRDNDLARYREVLNLCSTDRAYLSSQDRQYDPDSKTWRVLLVWGEYYLEDPMENSNARRQY